MTQENPMTSNRAQRVHPEDQQSEQLAAFISHLTPVEFLKPEPLPVGKSGKKKPVARQGFTDRVVTIAGFKTTVGRFLPVSHDGRGIETYVEQSAAAGENAGRVHRQEVERNRTEGSHETLPRTHGSLRQAALEGLLSAALRQRLHNPK